MKFPAAKLLLSLILAGIGIYSICIYFQAKALLPAFLPDHDFIPEIKKMMAAKQFQSAEVMCCNVIGMGLPRQEQAALLLQECRAARRSWKNNAMEAVKGFLTGKGNDSASLAGAVASDLTVYGDLRDLGIQGYRKLRGLPVDTFLVTLSSIGLAAELTGLTGIAPSLVKQLHRAGALTAGLLDEVRKVFVRLRHRKKLNAAEKHLFANLREVVTFHGMNRSKSVLKGLNSPEELAAAVKLQKIAPEVPWLTACTAPRDSGQLFVNFSASPARLALLKSAVRKGAAGTELLKKIRFVKWSAKNIQQGRFHALLLSSALENPRFFRSLPWIGTAAILLFVCLNGGTILRMMKKGLSAVVLLFRSPPSDNVPDSNNSECSCSDQKQAADGPFSSSTSENGGDKPLHSGRN